MYTKEMILCPDKWMGKVNAASMETARKELRTNGTGLLDFDLKKLLPQWKAMRYKKRGGE